MNTRKKDMADFLLLACIAILILVIDIPCINGGENIDRGRNLFTGDKKIRMAGIMPRYDFYKSEFKTESDISSLCDYSPTQAILGFKPFDLNRADTESLTFIRGIGPKLAKKIIDRRGEIGGFREIEDLLKVKGIGPSKLKALNEGMVVCR